LIHISVVSSKLRTSWIYKWTKMRLKVCELYFKKLFTFLDLYAS
jgi:hypothetical protein